MTLTSNWRKINTTYIKRSSFTVYFSQTELPDALQDTFVQSLFKSMQMALEVFIRDSTNSLGIKCYYNLLGRFYIDDFEYI